LSATLVYVYCVVPAQGDAARGVHGAPAGIDGSSVNAVDVGDLAALVSALDASEYASDVTSERAGDPEWLAPRAVAHDAVVTWASDHGAVVPLPMWVMFSADAGVTSMLTERAALLARGLDAVRGAREYGVRVYGDATALAAAVSTLDPALAALEGQISTASPGQAYLLKRKRDAARKTSVRDTAHRVAGEVHDRLSGVARSSALRGGNAESRFVLDAAYLVEDGRYDEFRAVLTELMGRYGDAGFRFEFTGPWPPYHFVRADE
jgi:hypothetical protein